MDAELKKTLKAVTLELRHLLEGRHDSARKWKPGDLEQRLAAIGVRRDRASVPVDELRHLAEEDRQARKVVDAYLKLREEAGVERSDAVAEFVRETAYSWANRLLALRCMEARELIDPVILQQAAYGGRSLEHHRLAQRHPELCAGADDGLFAVLDKVFREQAERLPMLFDPQAPGIALRPAPAALKDCFGLLSLNPDTLRKYRIRIKDDDAANIVAESPNPFTAPDALGWAYQYWNTEEKERVFEKVRTVKGAKIAGADIIPATQLYTEDYMVKFLVQNSLGATWMGMHPESKLAGNWEYYVKDADRAPVARKPVREITLLDPACGSGHFLLEAFDLFYAMYLEEGELGKPEEICGAILTKNLFGIDIDARAVQIAEVALWMKAAERAFDYKGVPTNLVAATASHLKGEAWEEFLASFEREPSVARVLRKFAQTMEHIDEIGSLARPAEDLREIIKQEHATWEKQVREKREGNYLFAEMNEDALSGRLPFHEISDEEFGDRLFYRARASIDVFTERARAAGEFEDQMLSRETISGFRLVDLLGRRYDVVVANPPWMGSKNMGIVSKTYLQHHYSSGRSDLYAAFILRCLELARVDGRIAMVTQQSWLFLNSFSELRSGEPNSKGFRGILRGTLIESLVQLGRYAFSELGNGVIQPLLFVLLKREITENHSIFCIRLSAPRLAVEQAQLLRAGIAGRENSLVSKPRQNLLLGLPGSPISYWLRDRFFELLGGRTLGDLVDVYQGLATANDPRFVRFVWEIPPRCAGHPLRERRWVPFEKGGGYGKWLGHHFWAVDWESNGARIKQTSGPRVQNEQHYFKNAWVYSSMASGSLGVRQVSDSLWGAVLADAIISKGESVQGLGAVLNCRLCSTSIRWLRPQIVLSGNYVSRIPLSNVAISEFSAYESLCKTLKTQIVMRDPTERTFDPTPLTAGQYEDVAAILHTLEGLSERDVFAAYSVSDDDVVAVLNETGSPAGWYPLIAGYSTVPSLPEDLPPVPLDGLADTPRRNLSPGDLADLKRRLHSLYDAGPGGTVIDDEPDAVAADDESEESATAGAPIPIPAETFVEELSGKLEVHPISVYWLIKEGRETEGWRCIPEEQRLMEDRLTVQVLRLLGHRWPKQVEAGEQVPDWADPDGIIPITPLAKETTLFERVQQRLTAGEIDASDFADVMSKPLDAWLVTEFFKHHTKQFKKRPIAWQVQSGRFTAQVSPAFACLVYYHKLDVDTLPKLRSQYVGPLRQRLETELRGIMAIGAEARSDRQVKRRAELDDSILELQKFDAVLEAVAITGFGPTSLHVSLRQYAIDDAMLALKARWLRRLTEFIAKSPLPDWLDEADRTDLHRDLRTWIANAMAHLDYSCARVGPKPPDQGKLASDPTAADLANLINPQAHSMLKAALALACDAWWKPFDAVVLGPDRVQIKALKVEQKDCEEQMDADPAPTGAEARHLRSRIKEIKEEVKTLTARIKNRAARANELRTQIECWESKEPLGWADWLAGQPLFDRVSSLDGSRATPTAIAEFIAQESLHAPDINDGVRVNIAPLQNAGILAGDVLASKDIDKAIADRAEWRADERRWVREGKLPQPGWWPEEGRSP